MQKCVVLLIFLLSLCTSALTCSAENFPHFSRWHQVSPSPEGNFLRSVAFGNGQFVAVGEDGTIISSTDGKSWNVRKSKATGTFQRVCAGNNAFIAVGDNGDIWKSTDAINWEKITSLPKPLQSVIFGDRFMAVNEEGKILSSQDGKSWQEANTPPNAKFSDVAYTGEGYIAAGDKIIGSTNNGNDWNTDSIELKIDHIVGGNGKFIISTDGGIYTSSNLENWNRTVKTKTIDQFFGNERYLNIIDLKFIGNKFVAISEDKIGLSSDDGVNWQQFDLTDYNAVTFGNGKFVSVGSGVISISEDANHWITTVDSNLHNIMAGVFANKTFFTFWQGLSTSSDGINYKQRIKKTDIGHGQIFDVVYGQGVFAALGSADGDDRAEPLFLTSKNGVTWNKQKLGVPAALESGVFAKGLFVIVGDEGGLITSKDGLNWQKHEFDPTVNLKKVIYAKGTFVAVGDNRKRLRTVRENGRVTTGNSPVGSGVIYISKNGIQWTRTYIIPDGDFNSVTFGKDEFVAVNAAGTAFNSKDGLKWNPVKLGFDHLSDIAYGDGRYVIAADFGKHLYYSSNARDWTKVDFSGKGPSDVARIFHAKNIFYGIGSNKVYSLK